MTAVGRDNFINKNVINSTFDTVFDTVDTVKLFCHDFYIKSSFWEKKKENPIIWLLWTN